MHQRTGSLLWTCSPLFPEGGNICRGRDPGLLSAICKPDSRRFTRVQDTHRPMEPPSARGIPGDDQHCSSPQTLKVPWGNCATCEAGGHFPKSGEISPSWVVVQQGHHLLLQVEISQAQYQT